MATVDNSLGTQSRARGGALAVAAGLVAVVIFALFQAAAAPVGVAGVAALAAAGATLLLFWPRPRSKGPSPAWAAEGRLPFRGPPRRL